MSKVFDCFMIHSELDMAELRFNILRDAVDYHVVVESGMTHSGQPKARGFGDALEAGRFAEFDEKIVYSYSPTLDGDHSWAREHAHRALISGVLRDLALPDDLVIVGDCDEIPNPDAIARVGAEGAALELDFFYYDFAHKVNQGWGISALHWGNGQDANLIRTGYGANLRHIPHAGWHLSYFMTPNQVVEKLEAFMHHADVAKDVPRDPAWIADKMAHGLDLFGRTVEIIEVNPELYLPEYVKAHREHYVTLGWLKAETIHAP